MGRLQSKNDIQIRFVTNTTKESKETLLQRLNRIGFSSISRDDMFTSLSAAVKYVKSNDLKPFYLLTEDAKKDFVELTETVSNTNDLHGDENSVVVGLAPDKFVYETINKAFRYVFMGALFKYKLNNWKQIFLFSLFHNIIEHFSRYFSFFFRTNLMILLNMMNVSVLMKAESKLIAVHEGKYYKRADGLAVGPGFFSHGLEYATSKKAIIIGKPNPYFFNSAIPAGVLPHECCMIGDVSVSISPSLFLPFAYSLNLNKIQFIFICST